MRRKIDNSEAVRFVTPHTRHGGWGATAGMGVLFISFGAVMPLEKPLQSSSSKAILFIEGAWRIERSREILAGADDSQSRRDRAANHLNGAPLKGFRTGARGLDASFFFGPTVTLRVFATKPRQVLWYFRAPNRDVVIATPAGFSVEKGR